MTLLLLLCCGALAEEPQAAAAYTLASEYNSAVLVMPIGPVSAMVASGLGTPAVDANLRMLHMPRGGVGWSAQAEVLRVGIMDVGVMSAGLEVGPRFAVRKRGLSDWTVTPFAGLGYTSVSAAQSHLAHYSTLSVGVDAGRTWVWNRFTMELGLGFYSAIPFGYTTSAEALADQRPVSVSPIKPSFTWSVGYAF